MPNLKIMVLAITLLGAAIPCTAQEQREVFAVTGIVSDGGQQDGRIWFVLDRVDQRFLVAASTDPDGLFAVLRDSAKTGRGIVVHYDPDGNFGDGGDKPIYIVRMVDYDGKTIAAQAPASDSVRSRDGGSASEAVLARGVALYDTGYPRLAHEKLMQALADATLRPALRILALKTDGGSLRDDAYQNLPPGSGRDGELVAALADYGAWKKLAPDETDPDLEIADVLSDLGDYDRALSVLRTAASNKSKDRFWPLVRIGAVYRTQGDYAHALGALDELVATVGPQAGMAYHYHRGWTLSALKRFDDAVAEFTAGIEGQPDYAWAFLRRSCAYAALGRFGDAVADQKQAIALFEQSSADQPATEGTKNDLARARSVLQILVAAADHAGAKKADGLCDGYTDYGDDHRDRSPLVPDQL